MSAAISGRRFLQNYLTTLAFIGLAYWVVSELSGFHRGILTGQLRLEPFAHGVAFTVHGLFLALIALYAVLLVPFYRRNPWLRSKAFVFLRGLSRVPTRLRLSTATRQAGLVLLLKFFFAPLMINWCLVHVGELGDSVIRLWNGVQAGMGGRALFDQSLFWACFQAILFVDTLLFTLGYLVEAPALRNRIRSVDPTWSGWFVCLICYPPFNAWTSQLLPWQSNDFPRFESDAWHFAANFCVLLAMCIYSWASVALGFKASNLTNRGIVSRGPYALVRHPAYAAKNLAWWIGALPTLSVVFASGEWGRIGVSLCALLGWTAIYVLRALTEERHLLMGHNGYAEYQRRVRWRFIPGVI